MQDILLNLRDLLAYDAKSPMLFSSGTFWALFLLFMPLYSSCGSASYRCSAL